MIRPATTDERFVALVGQGLRAAQEGNFQGAAAFLEQALELKPADAETWNSLGVILVRQGETVHGVDAFRRAVRLRPNHAEAHLNLAVALDREGKSAEAVAHYRAFLSLGAGSLEARDDVRRRLAEVSDSRSSVSEPK